MASVASNFEADVNDIAVTHHVIAAFEAQLAGFLDLEIRAQFGEILIADDFGANEPARDIAVDTAGGVECAGAAVKRPCMRLRLARRCKRSSGRAIDKEQ